MLIGTIGKEKGPIFKFGKMDSIVFLFQDLADSLNIQCDVTHSRVGCKLPEI